MDLRLEAESRARQAQLQKKQDTEKRGKKPSRYQVLLDTTGTTPGGNSTPYVAALAEIDFRLNGGRARAGSGEFVPPRWVPDEEASLCTLCRAEFDWWTRKHHCRNCGRIFCGTCSYHRSLLPIEFGLRDPQRVCRDCHDILLPLQTTLTNDIANHQRTNVVDVVSNGVRRYLNFPVAMTLGSEIRKASYATYNLFTTLHWIRDRTVPLGLLGTARGIAFITVAKGGWGMGARVGTGLVVARLAGGRWSAPTAVGLVGVSYGALAGADFTDYVVILTTDDAVNAFSGLGSVAVGAGAGVSVGPLGRCVAADMTLGERGCASSHSYSHSRGLYAGVSLDATVVFSRADVNHRFYGRPVTPVDLLRGLVPPPKAAQPLYDALDQALAVLPTPTYGATAYTAIAGAASSSSSGGGGGNDPNGAGGYGGTGPSDGAATSAADPLAKKGVTNVSSFESTSSVSNASATASQSNSQKSAASGFLGIPGLGNVSPANGTSSTNPFN